MGNASAGMKLKPIILGQEAIVPFYGLGRVTDYKDAFPKSYIEVTPYVCGYAMQFAPENVTLISPSCIGRKTQEYEQKTLCEVCGQPLACCVSH